MICNKGLTMDTKNLPVGVFDSGVGGLTVAKEIMRRNNFEIFKSIDSIMEDALTNHRFEVYYQAIDDVVSVRDINSPTGQSVVSIILGEKEIEIKLIAKKMI